MTTTCHLQVLPDYYTCPIDEIKIPSPPPNTNPRYKRFNQIHFTAGDEQQFHTYISRENDKKKVINIKKFKISQLNVELYHRLDKKYIETTFRYLFHKFKKGIFVKIHSNSLRVFLPFSKANFTNEWHTNIKAPPDFASVNEFIKFACNLGGFAVKDNKINAFISSWYSNNCLLRHEFPPREGDSGLGGVRDMLLELCKSRDVPDIEFFINKRDFPLLKKDLTEPYESIYNNRSLPLLSYREKKYYPILSMTTAPEFADIPVPTLEDWARVANMGDGRFFIPARSYKYNFNLDFSTKKPIAVFRGASTGEGTDTTTNIRLRVAEMSSRGIVDGDGLPFLDAGITKWNTRIRKEFGRDHLTTIDYTTLPFGLVSPLTPEEQSNYKYIINIDGHCSAFRLSLEFGMGGVILLVCSRYKLWFHDMIKPWVHYVPVREDLGDLIERIKWCKEHDAECRKIAENGLKFYREVLGREGILDYMQSVLVQLRKVMGYPSQYNKYRISEIQQYLIAKNLAPARRPSLLRLRETGQPIMDRGGVQIYHLGGEGQCLKYVEKEGDKYVFKYWESLNEIYTSINCLNGMGQYIPNFPKVCEYYFDDTVVVVKKEWVEGVTLDDWIKSSNFNMTDFVNILLQINLALFSAQSLYGFIHFDLYPWNIVIKNQESVSVINYPWIDGKMITIKTSVIPYIIDYGKSSIVNRGIRYGSLKYCTIHDTLTNLLSSLFEVVRTTNEVGLVLKLVNFVTNTTFRDTPFRNIRELRLWLKDAKKYDNMLISEKYELADRTSVDFINYILPILQESNRSAPSLFEIRDRIIPRVSLDSGELLQIVSKIGELDLESNYVIYNIGKIFNQIIGCKDIDLNTRNYLLHKISNLKLKKHPTPPKYNKITYKQFVDLDSGIIDKNIKINVKYVKDYMESAEIYFPHPRESMEVYSNSTYLFYKLIVHKTNS